MKTTYQKTETEPTPEMLFILNMAQTIDSIEYNTGIMKQCFLQILLLLPTKFIRTKF
jgi:hypothetical protein